MNRLACHSLAMMMLAPGLAEAQEVLVPTETPEEELEQEELVEQEEEERSRAESFLAPNVSPARAKLAQPTRLRGFTRSPPNVLLDVSRPSGLLRAGNFAIQPSLSANVTYDDNANAVDKGRDDQTSGNLLGSLRAQSLFERHSLGAQVDVAAIPIGRDDGEKLLDWAAGADGRLDLSSRSSLSAAVTGTYGTEDGASSEANEVVDASGEEATITDIAGTVAYRQQLRRLGWQVTGSMGWFDAEADGDGSDQADERDRIDYGLGLGADYDLSNKYGIFAEVDYDFADFDETGEGGSRDSQSVDGTVGVRIRLGRTLTARLGGGYSAVFFDDSARDDETNATAEASLDGVINLGRSTILGFLAEHVTERTTVDDAALVNTTTVGSSITRSLSRRSAIQLNVEGTRSDFVDVNRTDYDIAAEVAYSLAVTRNMTFNSSYTYDQRFADDSENDFYRNIVAVGIALSF